MRANTRREARMAFDEASELYDQARPGIPDRLVTSIARLTGIAPGDRVLDVGAGTGQLTLPLRRAGLEVTALEPGARLRALLSEHTAHDTGVTVHGGLFEDFTAPEQSFSAVLSANAWQWIDPHISYTKAAGLLHGPPPDFVRAVPPRCRFGALHLTAPGRLATGQTLTDAALGTSNAFILLTA